MVVNVKRSELGRSSFTYGGALLIPRLAAFLALIIFSRLLSPTDYGYFALFMISAELMDTVLFNWIRIAFMRLFPEHEKSASPSLLRRCCLAVTGLALLVSIPIAALIAWSLAPDNWLIFFGVLVCMTFANGAVRLRLAELQAQQRASQYFLIEVARSVFSLLLALVLVEVGGPHFNTLSAGFAGANVGVAGICLLSFRHDLPRIVLDRMMVRSILTYAGPIVPLTALQSLIPLTERYVIQFVAGPAAVGVYAAVQNLVQQPISMLASAIALAAFPIVMSSAELHGYSAAQARIREVGGYLLAFGLPAVCGIIALRSEIVSVLLGEQFRAGAVAIVPWMAVSALLLNFKYHYFDLAFHVTRRLMLQVATLLPTTLLTAPLIYGLFKTWGLEGAAAGACLASAAALAASWIMGQRALIIPHAVGELVRIAVSVSMMVVVLSVVQPAGGLAGLLLQIAIGGTTYALAVLALNVLDTRTVLMAHLVRLSAPASRREAQ
jgi:O-antigen/teichoic acid export membrane protein